MAKPFLGIRLVMCVMVSLGGCAWFQTVPLTGAYGDGFHRGCDAREHGSGYEARDADARAHLQERYRVGWGRGFNACLSPWEKEQRDKWLHGEDEKHCTKHQKKRGHCKA